MDSLVNNNVIYLHTRQHRRRRWRTHCLDCDPACERPFDFPVHQDVRTGDILTPCPACERIALVDAPRVDERFSGAGGRPVSR
jgi:hypothetical protein